MQLEKAVLGKIFFTEYDKSITGTSMRDPLGLQPIWSYYGRRVISHLTTVSTDIRGFREVLLCISICGDCKSRHKSESFRDLILLFEQLFIYSAIDHGMTEGILGADNGISKYRAAKENPSISSTETILVREISLGYYGRYKTPLNTMKVINSDSSLVRNIEPMSLYGSKRYNVIAESFDEFVQLNKSSRFFKRFKASDELFEAVCGSFRPDEKEFWTGKLQIDGSEKLDLMSACFELVNADRNYRSVFDELQNERAVKDIERLEPFLRCMESVFYQALSSKNVSNIVIDQQDLVKHRDRYRAFSEITDAKDVNSELLHERMKYLKEYCSPYKAEYIQNVIAYHKRVCEQKRSSAWLEVDAEGNVQTFVQPDILINIEDWGRDYYMASLYNIKKGIEELSL